MPNALSSFEDFISKDDMCIRSSQGLYSKDEIEKELRKLNRTGQKLESLDEEPEFIKAIMREAQRDPYDDEEIKAAQSRTQIGDEHMQFDGPPGLTRQPSSGRADAHREAIIARGGPQPPRQSVRRPEEVKFRTADEEKAAQELSGPPRRDTSAESQASVNLESFEVLGLMGEGAYGKVFLAHKKKGGKYYAIKAISKRKIMQAKKQHEVFRERQALIMLDHPNIVKMYWSFNDKKHLYFVLDLAPNGELFQIIRREGRLRIDAAKFAAAEIVNILEYIHSKGVAHRDLKPSNLMLDENYHLKLVDFGTAKIEEPKAERRKTICIDIEQKIGDQQSLLEKNLEDSANIKKKGTVVGTEDYIAPEVLAEEISGPPADIWSFGVILFMMLSGYSPFKSTSQYATFQNIATVNYRFPDPNTQEGVNFTPEAKDLIQKLLVKDPRMRLGAGRLGSPYDYDSLKRHPFFNGIDFDKVFLINSPLKFNNKYKRSTIMQKLIDEGNFDKRKHAAPTSALTQPKQQPQLSVKLLDVPDQPKNTLQNQRKRTSSDIGSQDGDTQQRRASGLSGSGSSRVLSEIIKKKNRLRFYTKRLVVLTDEPKLQYSSDGTHFKSVKFYEETKIGRVDKTTFSISNPDRSTAVAISQKKETTLFFRCNDQKQCDNWMSQLTQALEKIMANSEEHFGHLIPRNQSSSNLANLRPNLPDPRWASFSGPNQAETLSTEGATDRMTQSAYKSGIL